MKIIRGLERGGPDRGHQGAVSVSNERAGVKGAIKERPIPFPLTLKHRDEAAQGADCPSRLCKPIPEGTYLINSVACTYDRELLVYACAD
jgi:hypothetical protein